MGNNDDSTDTRFIVEIGSHRFDPKKEGARSGSEVTGGRKRLANELGTEPEGLPGSDRTAWLIQPTEVPEVGTVRRLRDEAGVEQLHGLLSTAFVVRPAAPVGVDPVVNKLDILVMEPRGVFDLDLAKWFGYYGNDFQNKFSRRRAVFAAGAPSPPDPRELKNNVFQVLVSSPVAGRWWIAVKAHRVDQLQTPVTYPFGRRMQGYALVACVELN